MASTKIRLAQYKPFPCITLLCWQIQGLGKFSFHRATTRIGVRCLDDVNVIGSQSHAAIASPLDCWPVVIWRAVLTPQYISLWPCAPSRHFRIYPCPVVCRCRISEKKNDQSVIVTKRTKIQLKFSRFLHHSVKKIFHNYKLCFLRKESTRNTFQN